MSGFYGRHLSHGRMGISFGRCLAFVAVLLVAMSALADGIYIPPLVVNQMPNMPSQRGIIVYRDGIEKLIVESAFDGQGKEMAWIVPTPAEPTSIKQTTPGLFTALELGLQPKVLSETLWGGPLSFLAVWIFLWGVIAAGRKQFQPSRACVYAFLWSVGIFFFTFPYIMGTLGGSSEPLVAGTHVSQKASVGNYEVQTLQADTPDALNAWLKENGFIELPEAGCKTARAYIDEGWHFVVAKLKRDGEGFTRPHPLLLEFPTRTPVYPMRLTALSGSRLQLDLFVIAHQEAVASGMERVYVDSFEETEDLGTIRSYGFRRVQSSYAALDLPSLVDLAGKRSVVTWLKAEYKPRDMDKDIRLTFKAPEAFRKTIYIGEAFKERIILTIILVMGIALLLIGGMLSLLGRKGEIMAVCLLLLCMCLFFSFSWRGRDWFPAVEILQYDQGGLAANLGWKAEHLAYEPGFIASPTIEYVKRYFERVFASEVNPYTKEPFRLEETPGGMTVFEDARGIVVRVFSGVHEFRRSGGEFSYEDFRITGEDAFWRSHTDD